MQCSGVEWNGCILVMLGPFGYFLIKNVKKYFFGRAAGISAQRIRLVKKNMFSEFCLPPCLILIFRAESDSGHDSPPHRQKCPPHVDEKIDLGFFGPPENFHFSKVANFFSFCEARSNMA